MYLMRHIGVSRKFEPVIQARAKAHVKHTGSDAL